VETGLLIDIFENYGLRSIAQVDLLERIHHNQELEALSKMSFAIIQTVLRKLEGRYERAFIEDVNKTMKLIRYADGTYFLTLEEVAEYERPPMGTLSAYQARRKA
jgi:glucosyl-3-phosphoglycerate synthase